MSTTARTVLAVPNPHLPSGGLWIFCIHRFEQDRRNLIKFCFSIPYLYTPDILFYRWRSFDIVTVITFLDSMFFDFCCFRKNNKKLQTGIIYYLNPWSSRIQVIFKTGIWQGIFQLRLSVCAGGLWCASALGQCCDLRSSYEWRLECSPTSKSLRAKTFGRNTR